MRKFKIYSDQEYFRIPILFLDPILINFIIGTLVFSVENILEWQDIYGNAQIFEHEKGTSYQSFIIRLFYYGHQS